LKAHGTLSVGLILILLPVCARAQSAARAPADELKAFKIAEGLEVRLCAAEPQVRQPLSLTFDDRGRLWVLQYIQYPNPEGLQPVAVDQYLRTKYDRRPDPPPNGPKGHDCIVILEDADGDGVMDHAKNFLSGLNLASGMALGYGGVFVAQPPYLLFYRDADGDDRPDGDPDVLLTGFGMEDAHAFANSLTWGPDGWLYGAQGSTVSASIRGIEFQQGIWRYHPRTKQFELFAEGGGNTWGIDFDRFGNLFAGGNTVEPVCHHVQGAYYVKGFGKHGPLHNPYSYGYFDPVKHYGVYGGGLTGGCSIYQGDALPARFQNVCIAPNLRQNAMRWYPFETRGSTFATRTGGDFIVSSDPWFRAVDTLVGPDGALYVADWYDINISHTSPKDRSQWYLPSRKDGRIWRITGKDLVRADHKSTTIPPRMTPGARRKTIDPPLGSRPSQELVALLDHRNEWQVRETLRILGERRNATILPLLKQQFADAGDEVAALRRLWAIGLSGGFDEAFAQAALENASPYIRAWTVRLLGDPQSVSPSMSVRLARLANSDASVIVRSQLACTAKRFPASAALPIIAELLKHDEDAADPHVPLLIWWAIESKAVSDRDRVLALLKNDDAWRHAIVRDVLLTRLARRYMAEGNDAGYAACVWLLAHAPTPLDAERIIDGMEVQLAGRRLAAPPSKLAKSLAVRLAGERPSMPLLSLALRLGIKDGVPKLIARITSSGAPQPERIVGIRALGDAGPPDCAPTLLGLLGPREADEVNEAILTAVGRFNDGAIGDGLLKRYSVLSTKLQSRVLDVLVSRPAWTRQLLAAVEQGRIDAKSVAIDQVRRMLLHGEKQISQRVTARWGSVRPTTPREKQGKILAVSQMLAKGTVNPESGHRVFTKQCAICHRLNSEGNQVGPDLTGADRKNLAILLPNVLDPSAVIRPEFRAFNVLLEDGRILTGLLADSNAETLTVLDAKNQRTVVKRSDVEAVKASDTSLMPENVLEPLDDQQIRDLFAYLRIH
jgi:putative membrane-bound dehydrogenase-like protein